jgi:hypothetical protein
MLTRAAPAFNRATQGAFQSSLLQPLTQSLFNCNQPLEHRGPVAFSNGFFPNNNGVLSQNGWNPADYPGLFPDSAGFIEAPGNGGYRPGDWYTTNYGSPEFDLRTEVTNNTNQYYTGPSVTIEGETITQNLTTENQTVVNLTVENINGEPAPGADGADGPAGPQGLRGLDGQIVFVPPPGNANDLRRINLALDHIFWRLQRLEFAINNLVIDGFPQGWKLPVTAEFDEVQCKVVVRSRPVKLRVAGRGGGLPIPPPGQ